MIPFFIPLFSSSDEDVDVTGRRVNPIEAAVKYEMDVFHSKVCASNSDELSHSFRTTKKAR